MDSKWPKVTLAEAGAVVLDCEHKTPAAQEKGIPYLAIPNVQDGRIDIDDVRLISQQDYEEWTRRIVPQAGDILLTRRGRVGDTAPIPSGLKCAIGQNLVLVRSNSPRLEQGYLRWALTGPTYREQVYKYLNVGAVFDSLNVSDIPNFKIPLPPLQTQRQIADILSAFDEKIELNRQMNRTLEQMARALFKSWFIDFDPVHAKQRGEQPAGMDPETAALFPDRFVEIDGKEVPKGWEWGNVHKNFQLTMGQSPPGDTYNESGEGLPFYQGKTDFGFRFPKKRIYCSTPTRLARRGSTLVSVRAPVGSANIAMEECAIGRGVASILHSSNSKSFTYYSVLSSRQYLEQFNGEGTVFGSINKAAFEAMETIEPEAKVIERFEELVGTLDNAIETNERSASLLISIRDSLLPRLLSGELDVSDWEKAVEAPEGAPA